MNRPHLSRGISRRRILQGAAASAGGLAAAGLLACGKGPQKTSTQSGSASSSGSGKHGSLTFAYSQVGQTLSPNSTAGNWSEYYAIFDPLTRLEANGTMGPALATSWESQSPTRWIFHLREGVQWSDGQPFTADDVKFTYDYIADPNNKSAIIARVSTVKSVEALDPKTVAINTNQPDPLIPRSAFFVFIMPKHYLGNPAFGDQAMATKPVGTGAYLVDAYSQGSQISLKKNPNSWRGNKGVDAINLQIVMDLSTRAAAFSSGQVDMADAVPLDQISRINSGDNTKVVILPATGYAGYDMEYFVAPFNDKRVRLALAHAIDYDAIKKTVYFGVPDVMQGQMLTKSTLGFNPSIKQYSYDPQASKQMLSAAGADKLNITMEYVGTNDYQRTQTTAVASFLKDIGVTSTINAIDVNVWRDGLYGKRHRGTLMFDSWGSQAVREGTYSLQWMLTSNAGKFYANPDFDAAYNAGASEFDDQKRAGLYQKAETILNQDPPGLWVVENAVGTSYRTDKIASFGVTSPMYFDEIVLK
jgi:peptide/nickel transport system substrate-binding protein